MKIPHRILCPGEGKISAAILDQDEIWQDKNGFVHTIETMGTRHLTCIEPFLLRKGEGFRWRWMMWQINLHAVHVPEVLGEIDGKPIFGRLVPLFSDGGGNLDGAFDDFLDFQMDRPLAEWLHETTLIRAINRALKARSGDG